MALAAMEKQRDKLQTTVADNDIPILSVRILCGRWEDSDYLSRTNVEP